MDEYRALDALRQGSEDTLGWLIDRYTPYVNAVVSNIIGPYLSAADIEETDADVFVTLWRHADRVEAASLKSWLGAVARNTARNRLRELHRELPLEDDVLLLPDADPSDEVERRERERLAREAVLSMEQPDREIFLRHYYYGQTVAVIAEEMGMSPSAVKSRLSRGREKLSAVLAQKL